MSTILTEESRSEPRKTGRSRMTELLLLVERIAKAIERIAPVVEQSAVLKPAVRESADDKTPPGFESSFAMEVED